MSSQLYSVGGFKIAFGIAQTLPRPVTQWLGPRIALASYAGRPEAKTALRANLNRVTNLSGTALDALCRHNVANFGRMLADYFRYAGTDAATRAPALLSEWRGTEHFDEALALGKGVVLVTAHLGNWELGGTLLALRGLPLTVITLEEPTSELTRWRDEFRRRLGIKTITVGPGHDFAFVEMIQTLRRNEVLAMLVDRPYAGTGTQVDFFGGRASFSSAPALLWQHTGAAVVPAFVLQEKEDRYISFADTGLPFATAADPQAAIAQNTQILASHFEAIIRQHPEQWFNYVPIWNRPA